MKDVKIYRETLTTAKMPYSHNMEIMIANDSDFT